MVDATDMRQKGAQKTPKFRDPRNDMIVVYDLDGNPHQMTQTNAREMERHMGWTRHAEEAAKRKKVPVVVETTMSQIKVDPVQIPLVDPADFAKQWEDLTAIPKAVLVQAAKIIGVAGVDGRTNEKRLAAAIEDFADSALTGAGDLDAPLPVEADDTPEVAAQKQDTALARRRRAFGALAAAHEISFDDTVSIVSVIEALGKDS